MIDHLVYAVPDVEAAVADLEARLGVRPTLGGRFKVSGAYNHILDLGNHSYLEVIGPDPAVPNPARERPFGLDRLTAPRIVTWCAKAGPEIEKRVAAAQAAGVDLGPVQPLSRTLPDGTTLAWRLTIRRGPPAGDGLVPFLIDWGDAAHPSASGAQGCRLVELNAEHPDPESVRPLLVAVGEKLPVREGAVPALIATIESPKGRVELR